MDYGIIAVGNPGMVYIDDINSQKALPFSDEAAQADAGWSIGVYNRSDIITPFSRNLVIYYDNASTTLTIHSNSTDKIELSYTSPIVSVQFFNNEDNFIVFCRNEVNIYDSNDLSLKFNLMQGTAFYNSACISESGNMIAYQREGSPYLESYLFDLGTMTLGSIGPTYSSSIATQYLSDEADVAFVHLTPDGGRFSVFTASAAYRSEIYDTIDGSVIEYYYYYEEAASQNTRSVKMSPDKTRFALTNKLRKISVFNPETFAVQTFTVPTTISTAVELYSVSWVDNDTLICSGTGMPSIHQIKISTGEITGLLNSSPIMAVAPIFIDKPTKNYQVLGSITESLANSTWLVTVSRADTSTLITTEEVTGSTFDIGLANDDNVIVTVSMPTPRKWKAGLAGNLDDLVVATDVETNPVYFKCTTAGISDSTEPVWNTTINSTTADGTVIWTCVERLVQPVSHGPITPTLIP